MHSINKQQNTTYLGIVLKNIRGCLFKKYVKRIKGTKKIKKGR